MSIGWNEGSVGIALSAMGFTALVVQTLAGDVIDKTHFDRRTFLALASIATAFSASAILFVHEGNTDHALMYVTKIVEGISSSFIAPCLAALTLATFGPDKFDEIMASNILWGHIGSVVSAILAGLAGYFLYPDIKYCFLVIGFSAMLAVGGVKFLPEGDPLMGRGLQSPRNSTVETTPDYVPMEIQRTDSVVSSYGDVFLDRKTIVVCLTGFFFQ